MKKQNYLAFALIFLVLGVLIGYYFGKSSSNEVNTKTATMSSNDETGALEAKISELRAKVWDLQKKMPIAGNNSYFTGRVIGKDGDSLKLETINLEAAPGLVTKTVFINKETKLTSLKERTEDEINVLLQGDSSLSRESPGTRFKEISISMDGLNIDNVVIVSSYVDINTEDEFLARRIVLQKAVYGQLGTK
jgi:hypothetical protein